MNAEVFNAMLKAETLTAKLAYRLKKNISSFQRWASLSPQTEYLVPIIECVPFFVISYLIALRAQFSEVLGACNLLVIDKSIFSSSFDFMGNPLFPSLNVIQLSHFLTHFEPDSFSRSQLSADAQSHLRFCVTRNKKNLRLELSSTSIVRQPL